MSMQPLFVILFSGLLTGNYALQGGFGAAPFLGFSKSRDKAWAMGIAVLVVMVLSTLIAWPVQICVLDRLNADYLQILTFTVIVIAVVYAMDGVVRKLLGESGRHYMPLIAANSAVLGLTINAMSCASYGEALLTALSVGLGYVLALVLMNGIREKISDKHVPKAFRGLPIANLDDCMGRIAAVDARLKNVNKTPLLGVAFTVRCPAGDNLMFHKALDLAQPGDILVIAAGGSMSRSLCGEIMSTYARSRGIAGFVVDGCIRDYDELSALTDFPVFARGVTPNGPYKNGPGEINFPVTVAGQVICPGDILVGDGDGLLVIKP